MRKLLVALLAIIPIPASAWTHAADQRIALKAAQLAPSDLRMLLETFESDYKEGLNRARRDEGAETHKYLVLSKKGRLRERIERETAAAITDIRSGKPMRSVVERLGMLSHYVADANNPFHLSDDDRRLEPLHNDFEHYFERRLEKFPTVFYGLEQDFRLSSYLDQTFTRTVEFYPLLSEEYFRGGASRTSVEFDDRSTAFGIASVCYSRAVTDLVNIYFHIWRQAGGDVRAAPVLRGSNYFLNAN
jgi:hypothetical protein